MRIRITDSVLILLSIITVVSSSGISDPCLDRQIAAQPDLPAKYANLTPPWQLPDGRVAKLFQSQGFVFQWMWMKSLSVKGLGKTVEDVLDFLSENNCLFVAVGPSVRQAILQQRHGFLSGEVSCGLRELYEKCVNKYEPSLCGLYPIDDDSSSATYRLEIGDSSGNHTIDKMKAEPIVLYEWKSTLEQSREKMRFTVDTLAVYDSGFGTIVVVDPLRKGFDHICEKKLIPTSEDWGRWSEKQPMKILGFYELRANGFSAKNETLHNYISNEVNVTDKKIIQKFYCEHVLKGVANLEETTPICHTKYPDKQDSEKILEIRTIMVQELGPVWNSSVGKAAENLEAVFCTDRQFVNIRTRLLRKLKTAYDIERGPEEPKIIENGQPMVKDNAQIHSRPILNMDAEPPILPPDYPNSPHARPNEKLEIVTPHHVAGAGSDPIAIRKSSKEKVLESGEEDEDDEDDEENLDAVSHDVGKPVDSATGIDYTRHNSMNNDLPVMRFDKVEEGGLSEIATSAMEISTSSSFTKDIFLSLVFVWFLAH